MLDFFFRPKRPAPAATVGAPIAPARALPSDIAPPVDTAQPEDLAYWRAEDELAKLAALARSN
tara:strand:- start:216 stop:404 length:189 start_codon:yes stop_codon:yes gene_type:complete